MSAGRDAQSARKRHRKRDGSWVIAISIAPNVIEFGKLVVVPDRTILDAYEDALGRARAALRAGIEAGDIDNAIAIFEASVNAAFELLREALKS
jgi:hypothetical protein